MSSSELAEATHKEEKWAAHAALSIVSPGKDEEEKDQDRLKEFTDGEETMCQFAIVCDGTTTSMYAAAAAAYVAGEVRSLFQEDGLQRVVETLQEKRRLLLEKPLKMNEGQSALLRSMYEEIVKEKSHSSYQTTFIAVCLKREESDSTGMISIKAIGCGDSALFIFGADGDLRYNNINLSDAQDPFKHSSPFTAVLPDSYDRETNHVLHDFKQYPEDVQLLLCSDGFYDGFANFKELHEWLNEHVSQLADSEMRNKCLSELHHNLNQKKGDDDISFIWLYPNKTPEAEAEAEVLVVEEKEEEITDAENSKSGKPGIFARLFAAINRWFKLRNL